MRIIASIMLFFLAGCGTYNRVSAPWTVVVAEGPWASSDGRAVLESRAYWASLMAAVMTSEERFRAPDGRYVDAERAVGQLISFLEKSGALQKWPETDGYINSRAQRLAPYRIHIASVFPVVAILTGHDFGPIKNRSVFGLMGDAPKGALHDDRILNHIEIGSTVPISDTLFWVSSDIRVPITEVPLDAKGGFEIKHARIELAGRRVGDAIIIERKR